MYAKIMRCRDGMDKLKPLRLSIVGDATAWLPYKVSPWTASSNDDAGSC